ncbi:MAG: enoyl-CoA hydratase/isomerase family protein, partial [Proteobacteria bacterium]|nr:enoyl-CoA hydratase/isomerase family protein [Pseudomonadota bacterium]
SHLSTSSLLKDIDEINAGFQFESIEEIIEYLQRKNSDWSRKTLQILLNNSPMSLKITLKHLEHARHMNFNQVIEENRMLSKHFLKSADFIEGIRALLVDKDNHPQWSPSRFDQITDKMILNYF